jgi:uncharacterized damage-inducible protein DinB
MVTTAKLLQELDQEAQATRRLLERIPDDQLDWQPHAKSMTLGRLAMQIATLPGGIAEISTWPSFDVSIEQPQPSAANSAELLAALDESLARARTVLSGMGDEALSTPWRLVNGDREIMTIPRAGLLRTIMLNHWYHHRGQLTVYLRELDVPLPGIYGPSADEKLFGA